MYGKINSDGTLEIFTEKYIIHDGMVTTNPDSSTLRKLGYKPIYPEEAYIIKTTDSNLVAKYRDEGRSIYMWHETEDGYMGEIAVGCFDDVSLLGVYRLISEFTKG